MKGALESDRTTRGGRLVLVVGLGRCGSCWLCVGRLFWRVVFLGGLLEFSDRLPKSLGEAREFGASEEEHDDQKDHDELWATKTKNTSKRESCEAVHVNGRLV